MGKLQLRYKDLFLAIDAEDEYTEPLFVCMNTENKVCWIETVGDESGQLGYFQQQKIKYKKATSSQKVAEFILQNQPDKFQENYHIQVFQSKQPDIKMYFSSNIIKGVAKCDFHTFIKRILGTNESGKSIMDKLKEFNPTLYDQLAGRGEADLSDINGEVSILRYAKFHKFIKNNW